MQVFQGDCIQRVECCCRCKAAWPSMHLVGWQLGQSMIPYNESIAIAYSIYILTAGNCVILLSTSINMFSNSLISIRPSWSTSYFSKVDSSLFTCCSCMGNFLRIKAMASLNSSGVNDPFLSLYNVNRAHQSTSSSLVIIKKRLLVSCLEDFLNML